MNIHSCDSPGPLSCHTIIKMVTSIIKYTNSVKQIIIYGTGPSMVTSTGWELDNVSLTEIADNRAHTIILISQA